MAGVLNDLRFFQSSSLRKSKNQELSGFVLTVNKDKSHRSFEEKSKLFELRLYSIKCSIIFHSRDFGIGCESVCKNLLRYANFDIPFP